MVLEQVRKHRLEVLIHYGLRPFFGNNIEDPPLLFLSLIIPSLPNPLDDLPIH